MRAVESGQREEHRGEDAVVRQEPQARVLVELAADEPDAEDDGRDQPVDETAPIALLYGVDRELHGHARREQRDGVDRDERNGGAEDARRRIPVRLVALLRAALEDRLPLGDARAQEEVRREERGEE